MPQMPVAAGVAEESGSSLGEPALPALHLLSCPRGRGGGGLDPVVPEGSGCFRGPSLSSEILCSFFLYLFSPLFLGLTGLPPAPFPACVPK